MMAKIKDRTEKDRICGVGLFGHHLYDDWIFGQNMIGQWNDRSYFEPTIYQTCDPFLQSWPRARPNVTERYITFRNRIIVYVKDITGWPKWSAQLLNKNFIVQNCVFFNEILGVYILACALSEYISIFYVT